MSVPPSSQPSPYHAWIRPLVQASFWLSALLTGYFVLQGLLVWPLHDAPLWQLLAGEAQHRQMRSLTWLLAHPVGASMITALLCLVSAVASWGLLRERRWGLWSFVVMLLLSALANFAITWWLDVFMRDMIVLLADQPDMQQSLQPRRWMMTFTLLGTSVLFLGLQGWLAWRLLRPDIRSRFH
ncbi:hypothetical protein [Stenotrophomonas maltophilia group sp. Smal35]|uniref:hypothetical protein n=1 Tax=Stenotrophomonas maltophilia group sp. Smal35 TaxID=3377163 RepID=UPI0025522C9D|nr:hypothetical protein [Stenotrophomonas maltophilia]